MQQQHSAGGGRTPNARAGSSQGGTINPDADTVRYINKQENPDHPVFQDDDS